MGAKFRYLMVMSLCFIASSCGNQLPPDANHQAATTNASQPAAIEVPTDESLPLEKYHEMGMPACDQIWTGEQMAQAASVLTTLFQFNPKELPRFESDRSGELFARLVAAENLGFLDDQSIPVNDRMPRAMLYMESSNRIFKMYVLAFMQRAGGGAEVVEWTGAILRLFTAVNRLVDEFVPTLDQDDPSYPVRMKGLERLRNATATTIDGALQTLTESHAYHSSDLKTLAVYLEDALPEALLRIPEQRQLAIMNRLQALSNDPAMQYLKMELDSLVKCAHETLSE